MCGISGAIGACGPEMQAAVTRMQSHLIHRGPDDAGQWHTVDEAQRGVSLAHRRLAIIDLSTRGRQPMQDPATGHVVCYNGEIYNYRALRRQLQARGHHFQSDSDTEVLLKAYAQWGLGCLDYLQGIFAFALWDARHGELHLVRDRLGVKPLYYAAVGGEGGQRTLLFASELRALLGSELVARQLDPTAMAQTVWHGFPIEPRTMVAGAFMLEAGHHFKARPDGTITAPRRYWQVPEAKCKANATASAESATKRALTDAVESRLVSDAPLGVFLSGGVDSTAVAAVAARASAEPVRTFSVTFDEAGFDESNYANEVARAIGTNHHPLHLTEARFVGQLEDALASLDQPSFDALNTYFISQAVREAGLTVALAGTGGDELFGGYRTFADLPWARRWAKRARYWPETTKRALASTARHFTSHRKAAAAPQQRWGKVADVLNTDGDLTALYQTEYALFTREFFTRLIETDHAPLTFGLESHQIEARRAAVSQRTPLAAIAYLERQMFLGQRLLRDTDAASMANALEVRVPFLDHRIWQSAAGLSDRQRFEPIGRKRLLRELTEPEVPGELFDRPKAGFELPIERWLRGRLQPTVDATLRDERLCRSVGLSPTAVADLWRAFQDKAPGIYWSRVWSLFTLLRWCQTHNVTLDNHSAHARPLAAAV